MKKEVVRMEYITKYRDSTKVLDNFRLEIYQGEIVGILGLSGAGKSNICRLLAKLELPDQGRIIINEQIMCPRETDAKGYPGVYCLHDFISLIPQLTVADNIVVMNGSALHQPFVNKKSIHQQAENVLKQVGLDFLSPATKVASLSVARQRLVEIAKGIARGAIVFVMDVIADSYTPQEKQELYDTMRRLQKQGISFLQTSHEPRELLAVVDRMVILRNGRAVKSLYRHEYQLDNIFSLLVGVKPVKEFAREYSSTHEIVLDVIHVDAGNASDVSFSLYKGEILGILDVENNVNHSLYALLKGERRCHMGGIFLENRYLEIASVDEAVRKGIGFMDQDSLSYGILPNLDFAQNLSLMMMDKCVNAAGVISAKTVRYIQEQYWNQLQQPDSLKKQKVQSFHVHVQQQILLLRWLIYQPKVLICINPCSMMDVVTQRITYSQLDEISKTGTAVLILSSHFEEIDAVCDRMLLLGDKGIRASLDRQQMDRLHAHDIY